MGELDTGSLGQLAKAFGGFVVAAFVAHAIGMDVVFWLTTAAILVLAALAHSARTRPPQPVEPWPWPADFFAAVARLGRPIDPEPERVLPLTLKPGTARITPTHAGIAALATDKPELWSLALFASVLVRRRNALQHRLRSCAIGYQPLPGEPLRPYSYTLVVGMLIQDMEEVGIQVERFVESPAFRGAFGEPMGDDAADADAIVHMADRLMDYHEQFVEKVETCLRMGIEASSVAYAQDVAAFVLCRLVAFDRFITTFCERVTEAQELLPYLHDAPIELDPVGAILEIPDDLNQRMLAHLRRSTAGRP